MTISCFLTSMSNTAYFKEKLGDYRQPKDVVYYLVAIPARDLRFLWFQSIILDVLG